MANFSFYISGQSEQNDVTEFFQKKLIGEGENPIAFFDGVFYESHQERVGNIVFQDYLIYTDRAVYLWARGSSKDYLDRFTLGTVSVNSRNKDSAFATLNLKIRREDKEPIYVIFDMVEIREAETIVKLHTVVESTIEDHLGVNFRQEIPKETSVKILQDARRICAPQSFSIPLDIPEMPVADAGIGYGQDLLEQYKASIGYPPEDPQQAGSRPPGGGFSPKDAVRGLESMLPTDPASLKRIASQIKDMVGDAPFKLRDQVMKDLQHVPNDVATVLTAVNELITNISDNPLAERFVMNAIKTAVKNDGVLGSLSKIIKMTSGGFGGGAKKPAKPANSSSGEENGQSQNRSRSAQDDDDDDPTTVRRKKISIRDDSDPNATDPFSDDIVASMMNDSDEPAVPRVRTASNDDFDTDSGVKKKKVSVKMDNGSADNDIARKLMSYDESERDAVAPPVAPPPAPEITREPADAGSGVIKKKVAIKAVEGSAAEAEIARKLMSYDESQRESSATEPQPVLPEISDEEPAAPRRKKIQIKAETDEAEITISEDIVFSALNEQETVDLSEGYMTIESDVPAASPAPLADEPQQDRQNLDKDALSPVSGKPSSENGKADRGAEPSDGKHSVSVKSTP